MRLRALWWTCAVLAIHPTLVLAQRSDEEEQRLIADLRSRASADVVQAFEAATAKLDEGNVADAERGYARVLERAPDFTPALRRRCSALAEMRRFDEALALCARAMELEPTPPNALAMVRFRVTRGE